MKNLQTFEEFLNENLNEASSTKSRLDTKKYIEPEEMEATLSQIYHILSGNVRDYISIKGIEDTIKDLKKYDKTKYI
jgi:predicted transcriptional regulator